MKVSFRQKLKDHQSFWILILSAGVYYFFNIWLKQVVSDTAYGEYSLLNSYVTIASTFAVLGGDQLILREAESKDEKLVLAKSTLKFSLILLICFSLMGPAIFSLWFDLEIYKAVLLCLVSLLAGLSILIFSFFRIANLLVKAQIQKNIWKLLLFVTALLVWLATRSISVGLLYVIIVASFLAGIIIHLKDIRALNLSLFKSDTKPNYRLWLGFALSMLIMSLLSNGDRFLIDRFVGREELGEYFYLQNLFLFPLTQLQNYSGFREFSNFKNRFSLKELRTTLVQNASLALVIAFGLLTAVYLLDNFYLPLQINWGKQFPLILLLTFTGMARVSYAVLSAGMGATATSSMVKRANVWSLILFVLITIPFCFTTISIYSITTVFLLYWLIRGSVFYKVIVATHEI